MSMEKLAGSGGRKRAAFLTEREMGLILLRIGRDIDRPEQRYGLAFLITATARRALPWIQSNLRHVGLRIGLIG